MGGRQGRGGRELPGWRCRAGRGGMFALDERKKIQANLDQQISLGDQTSYYLSTARNELGVLLATSEAGNQMYPISWKTFRDPETGKTETRKVAKPI